MRKVTLLLAMFCLSMTFSGVQGQVPTAQVEISCSPEEISVDVYPGTTGNSGDVICTVSNPNSQDEKIELSANFEGFEDVEFIGGNIIDIPAGDEVDVTVRITAPEEMVAGVRSVTVKAKVIEVNGVPPSNVAESSQNLLVGINSYDNYSLSYDAPTIVVIDDDGLVEGFDGMVLIENNGNYASKLLANITALQSDLDSEGLIVSIPQTADEIILGESWNFTFIVGYNQTTGEPDMSNWEVLANGSKVLYVNSTITFESEDVNSGDSYCYQCNQTVDINLEIYHIEGIYGAEDSAEGEDEIPGFLFTTSIISVLGALVIVSYRQSRDE